MFKIISNIVPITGKEIYDKTNRSTAHTVFSVAVFSILLGIINCSMGYEIIAIINLSLIPVAIISLYLMKKGMVLISKISMYTGCVIATSLSSIMFEQETIVIAFFIPLIFSMQVVFHGAEIKYGRILMVITGICTLLVLFSGYKLPNAYAIIENDLKILQVMSIAGALFFCLMISNFIYKVDADIVTKMDRQRRELIKNNSILNATLETRDRLFNLISHDLRSPFLSIDASIELLRDPRISAEEQNAVLRSLGKKSESTIALLNNLLMWSQHQTDTIKFDPEPIYLDQIEESIFNVISALAEEKRLKTKVNFEPGISVFADRNMLEAILRNLISNAIKFSTNGSTIEINAVFDKNEVVFSVIDSGIGLSENDLRKLLSRKAYTTEGTNKEQGHGIGLLLVHEFIAQHGSELKIESEAGKGSKFSFKTKAVSG